MSGNLCVLACPKLGLCFSVTCLTNKHACLSRVLQLVFLTLLFLLEMPWRY